MISRKVRIFVACSLFFITFVLCSETAGQMASGNVLPDSIGYVNGYPNAMALYVVFIIALISFGIGVFTLVRKKLVAIIITVIGVVLIGFATFLAGFLQGFN